MTSQRQKEQSGSVPKNWKQALEQACAYTFTAASLTLTKPSVHRQTNREEQCGPPHRECYSALKRKGILPPATHG